VATIRKKQEKWCVEIRRSFHKHLSKSFITKHDVQRWVRETERLIEIDEYELLMIEVKKKYL